MSRNTEMDAAVQAWDEAHNAALQFYRDNDVREPTAWAEWLRLREIEDDARFDADQAIDLQRLKAG